MIKFIAECKCYGTRIELHLGREYLGLSSEFSTPRVITIVSNVKSDEVHDLISRLEQGKAFFITQNKGYEVGVSDFPTRATFWGIE